METIWQDLRYALRALRRSPGFTAIAVLALGLGIGANAAVFSVVNAVLLRPLAYKIPEQLVVVESSGYDTVSPANFLDWKKQTTVFESMGAAEFWTPDLTGRDKPEQLYALHLTPGIFPMLGVAPQLGRTLLPEEDQPGSGEHVAVIGYGSVDCSSLRVTDDERSLTCGFEASNAYFSFGSLGGSSTFTALLGSSRDFPSGWMT